MIFCPLCNESNDEFALPQPDGDFAAVRVPEHGHRFHDLLDAGAATAAEQTGGIAGQPDRRAERVQHREEHLRIGTAVCTPASSRYSSTTPESAARARSVAGILWAVATLGVSPTR